jgi:hypothetical protein
VPTIAMCIELTSGIRSVDVGGRLGRSGPSAPTDCVLCRP